MTQNKELSSTRLRLNRLTIENYKRLDNLEIEFPHPLMERDTDILVFGSRNGVGKTSVLECSSLLLLAAILGADKFQQLLENSEWQPGMDDFLVKTGHRQAVLTGEFELGNQQVQIRLIIQAEGLKKTVLENDDLMSEVTSLFKKFYEGGRQQLVRVGGLEGAVNRILAFSGEPLILPPLLHFNSYRKIKESNPDLGMMTSGYFGPRNSHINYSDLVSFFKMEVMQTLMGKAALMEGLDPAESDSVLFQLNDFMKRYGEGGRIEVLRPLSDSTVDIRIKPMNGKNSFSFNGLSSGQKEMIATLFLIWKHTHKQPSIVLIDEPELHLNAEWHGGFIRQLRNLAPHNQYILATHSEEIFRSVDEAYRAILEDGENEGGDAL